MIETSLPGGQIGKMAGSKSDGNTSKSSPIVKPRYPRYPWIIFVFSVVVLATIAGFVLTRINNPPRNQDIDFELYDNQYPNVVKRQNRAREAKAKLSPGVDGNDALRQPVPTAMPPVKEGPEEDVDEDEDEDDAADKEDSGKNVAADPKLDSDAKKGVVEEPANELEDELEEIVIEKTEKGKTEDSVALPSTKDEAKKPPSKEKSKTTKAATVDDWLKSLSAEGLFTEALSLYSVRERPLYTEAQDGAPGQVPNIVHLLMLEGEDTNFTFARRVSLLAVNKLLSPAAIVVWGDRKPEPGDEDYPLWHGTLGEVFNVWRVKRKPPAGVSGRRRRDLWMRLDLLHRYGGIFLGSDVLVLRPFSDLLDAPLVMGRETQDSLFTGVIISAPKSKFIERWMETLTSSKSPPPEAELSRLPLRLASDFPDEIRILPGSFSDPQPPPRGSQEPYALFCGHYDLSESYALNIYRHGGPETRLPGSKAELDGFNCTLGDAMRKVVYGNPRLLNGFSETATFDGCPTK